MSSSSDSETDAAEKARLAFAVWEPPKPVEKPKTAPKPGPAKHTVIGYQAPDFREVPKSLDTLEDFAVERKEKKEKKENVFGESMVLAEQKQTAKTTRDEFYSQFKDQNISGLIMSKKEQEEDKITQRIGAQMLDKRLNEELAFVDSQPGDSGPDDDNGGISVFTGSKTRLTTVVAPVPPKIGLIGGNRPAAWTIRRSTRADSPPPESKTHTAHDNSDSDSDSEETRQRKVQMAGVVVDFSSLAGGFISKPASSSKPISSKSEPASSSPKPDSQDKHETTTEQEDSRMSVDLPSTSTDTSHKDKEKKPKKDKKHKKHKKDKKDMKDKKEKSKEKSKKRKREERGDASSDDSSLG